MGSVSHITGETRAASTKPARAGGWAKTVMKLHSVHVPGLGWQRKVVHVVVEPVCFTLTEEEEHNLS